MSDHIYRRVSAEGYARGPETGDGWPTVSITLEPTVQYFFGPYEVYRFPRPTLEQPRDIFELITAEHIEAAFDRMARVEVQHNLPPCTHSTLPLGATCLGCGRTTAQIEGRERAERKAEENAPYEVPGWAPRLTTGRQPRETKEAP